MAILVIPVNTDFPLAEPPLSAGTMDEERSLQFAPRRVTTPDMPAATSPTDTAKNVDEQAGIAAARPSMIWIGAGEHPEFAPALAALRRHAKVTTAVDMNDVVLDRSTEDCAGIVIAQRFAGQFPVRCLAALRRRLPTAPAIIIVGSFTEGERRSGEPLVSAIRIPWAHAATVLDRELRRLRAGTCPNWGFGETLTDDERVVLRPAPLHSASNNSDHSTLPAGTTIGISASDSATAAWLVGLVGRWGATITSTSHTSSPAPRVILWAAPSQDIAAQCRLHSLTTQFPETPILALANFPRSHLLEVWRRFGVAEHCALPVDCDDLHQKLVALIECSKHCTSPN